MLNTNMMSGRLNETVLDIPWNQTLKWLVQGDHYMHVHVADLSDDHSQGSVVVTEIYQHYSWFFAVFWLLLGVLITIIMHIPVYTLLGQGRRKAVQQIEKNTNTCPPKYENQHQAIEVPDAHSFIPQSLSTKTLNDHDKVEPTGNAQKGSGNTASTHNNQ